MSADLQRPLTLRVQDTVYNGRSSRASNRTSHGSFAADFVRHHSTIASAVVIPEPAEQTPPPIPKRRQSSTSESGNKRPRLSTEASHDGKNGDTPAEVTIDRRHDRRKSGQAEERKRGQRLFGALIGTLSQSSSSTAQKRRVDIEKKQQAKLKLQAEEYDEKKRKRFEELMVIRRREQKKFDKQSVYSST